MEAIKVNLSHPAQKYRIQYFENEDKSLSFAWNEGEGNYLCLETKDQYHLHNGMMISWNAWLDAASRAYEIVGVDEFGDLLDQDEWIKATGELLDRLIMEEQ